MNLVVLDLEWNQAMSSKSEVFNHLPIHLRGEIIEIGAVRLNPDLSIGDEFTADVRPVYFRRMHYKVKKITGFDKDRLSHGVTFPEAMERFRAWCGDDVTFLTWGWDDQGIFEQNIIIHDLDWDWIAGWINLQMIYNLQTGGDKNQKSLASAMEHFGIEQTRIAHDALGDAYNTALVTTHLTWKKVCVSIPRQMKFSQGACRITSPHRILLLRRMLFCAKAALPALRPRPMPLPTPSFMPWPARSAEAAVKAAAGSARVTAGT